MPVSEIALRMPSTWSALKSSNFRKAACAASARSRASCMDSRSLCMPVAKKFFRFLERTRDNVDGYEFSDAARCRRTCVQRRIDGTNVSANKHSNITIEKVFLANKNDVGCLDHCVRRLNCTDQ